MNGCIRTVAFCIGFGTASVVLAAGNAIMPGMWLPAAYVVLMLWLVISALESRLSPALIPLALAGACGFLGLWTNSVHKTSLSFLPGLTYLLVTGLPLVAGILLLWAVTVSGRSDRRALAWLAVGLGCACVVAFLSSDKGGADPMIRFFENRFGLPFESAELATKIVRKSIHFSFYGFVGLCAYQASRQTRFALLFALLLAVFDEVRQSTFASRSGSGWDVLLDMAGAAAFVWVASRIAARRERKLGAPIS